MRIALVAATTVALLFASMTADAGESGRLDRHERAAARERAAVMRYVGASMMIVGVPVAMGSIVAQQQRHSGQYPDQEEMGLFFLSLAGWGMFGGGLALCLRGSKGIGW